MEQYDRIDCKERPMPLPEEVFRLAALWPKEKPLFVVGGAVRDWTEHLLKGRRFKPKDFDLASELTADEVKSVLDRKVKYTEQGAAFGVIAAHFIDQTFEIATFREEWYDPENGDGRRPDKVKQGCTPALDASRRDLYINALFYDIRSNEIRDYNFDKNGKGEGFKDIEQYMVRFVGDPWQRIQEDKLRVLRYLRFLCRYHKVGYSAKQPFLDSETLMAIHANKALIGVSAERKLAEFLSGLEKCQSVSGYLETLAAFQARDEKEVSLLEGMFPGVEIDTDFIFRIEPHMRNPKLILAFLMLHNDPTKMAHPSRGLGTQLKFPSWLTDSIEFLLRFHRWNFSTGSTLPNVLPMLKRRDKFYQDLPHNVLDLRRAEDKAILLDFVKLVRKDLIGYRTIHFLEYRPQVKAEELLYKGVQGMALGKAMEKKEHKLFLESEKLFLQNMGMKHE